MTKTDQLFVVVTSALVLACGGTGVGSGGGSGGTLIGGGGGAAGAVTGNGGSGQTGAGGGIGGDSEGTWVVTGDGGNAKPPGKGAGGGTAGGAGSGVGGASSATCAPGVVGAIVTGCGYPYTSDVALTSVAFNESEVLRAIRPSIDAAGGIVSLLYNDEHALTMGVRQVVVKTAAGSTSTDYSVSPLTSNPGSVLNPLTGTNALVGDNSGLDPSLRPLWPVLYVTDVTKNPDSRAGDWQMGGRPINPNAVYGTWKSAVRTVDETTSPATVSVTPDADPAKNDWNLGITDPVPSGIKDEGWSAEVKWAVTFQPGHSYRLQVIVHDGDQNKAGGDCGEACIVFCAGGSTTPPPGCPDSTRACGEGMAEGGGYAACDEGESCLNGCCTTLTCPTDAYPCGQIGAEGELIGCVSGTTCVSGCCISSIPIP
jgi:hypothetical protein